MPYCKTSCSKDDWEPPESVLTYLIIVFQTIKISRSWNMTSDASKEYDEEIALEITRCLMRFSRIVSLEIELKSKRMRIILLKALPKSIRVDELMLSATDIDYSLR